MIQLLGAPNKVEPTTAFKQSGFLRNEGLIRSYVNYELDNQADWINFLHFSTLPGNASTSGGAVVVAIPAAYQDGTDYRVTATPKVGGLGNVWVVNTDATQFTINSDVDGSIDWVLTNK